ncbi:MAG: hypothetical protein PHU14_06700 [Methylovulum sp.]|nr:hypothetical protein [Methylovulum sp.]
MHTPSPQPKPNSRPVTPLSATAKHDKYAHCLLYACECMKDYRRGQQKRKAA